MSALLVVAVALLALALVLAVLAGDEAGEVSDLEPAAAWASEAPDEADAAPGPSTPVRRPIRHGFETWKGRAARGRAGTTSA